MAVLMPEGKQSFQNAAGAPLVGGKLYTYDAGTNTPRPTYADEAGTVPNTNPIILDARGEATIFWDGAYKAVLTTAADVVIWTVDDILTPDVAFDALIARLLNPASAADGAGMIGFNAAIAYAVSTIGRGVQNAAVTPSMFGAVGDGVTDDTVALQAWAASIFPKAGENKTFKVNAQLTFAADNCKFDGRGMVIDGSTAVLADSAVIYVLGSLSAVPDLSVSPARGDVSLTFGAAHTMVAEDVGIIYNPTNSSWSTKQSYYRAGEFFKATFVSSPTVLKITGGLYAGYVAANVDVYKMAKNEVIISNTRVIAPGSGFMSPFRVRLATKVRMNNVIGVGSAYTGVNLDRCYDVDIAASSVAVPVQVAASKYGISVGNSQHVRIRGCHLEAVRHAVNIGGDDFTGSVPNRDVRVSGSYLANDAALTLVSACDIHGNSQDIWYESNTIKGGGSFGGRDCHYINNDFLDFKAAAGSLIFGGSEWLGGIAEVRGGRIYGSLAYTQGLVRLSTDANVNSDSTLIVADITVDMPLCDTLARCDLTAATFKVNAVVDGITFLSCPNLIQVCRMTGTGAAGDADYVIVDNIVNAKAGAFLYTATLGFGATAKLRLMRQSGAVDVTAVIGVAVNESAVVYRLNYGNKVPVVQVSHDQRLVGIKAIASHPRAVTATGFQAAIYTCDAANFAAGDTISVGWTAGVNEI